VSVVKALLKSPRASYRRKLLKNIVKISILENRFKLYRTLETVVI